MRATQVVNLGIIGHKLQACASGEDLSEYLYKAGKENSVVIGHSTKANPNINGDKTKNEEQDYRHGKRKVFNNGNVILEVVKKGRITGLEIKEALNKR